MSRPRTIRVALADRSYPIRITSGDLEGVGAEVAKRTGANQVALITVAPWTVTYGPISTAAPHTKLLPDTVTVVRTPCGPASGATAEGAGGAKGVGAQPLPPQPTCAGVHVQRLKSLAFIMQGNDEHGTQFWLGLPTQLVQLHPLPLYSSQA